MRHFPQKLPLVFTLLFSFLIMNAHPWKPNHYVIIDTDGGFDDFRAITMMLASPAVRVMGITTSNGVISAEDTYYKVRCLLKDLYHEGIPVGINNDSSAHSKNCQSALEYKWGNNYSFTDTAQSAIGLILDIMARSNDKIELVCLGSLNTAENLLKTGSFKPDKLKRIVWTSKFKLYDNNFNYNTDSNAFSFVSNQSIPLEIITGDIENFEINEGYENALIEIANPYSQKIIDSYSLKNESPFARFCFDESAALFYHFPAYFITDTITGNIVKYKLDEAFDNQKTAQLFTSIISGQILNRNQVFKYLPSDTSFYYSDIDKIMTETIRKFGIDEWTACVFTNELHRHLGVYAIIGAKMGIRAREYFGIGADEMKIDSYAGLVPPFSCMNDGLQVSTGGTLGHGLITVDSDLKKEPKATFSYLGKKISISLKEEYRREMESAIKEISSIYGLDSNVYWELVRIEALNYWANWDRHLIFDIKKE